MQTGVFGGDYEYVDYSCPEIEPFMIRSSVHKYVAMFSPVYFSAKYALGRTHAPMLDLAMDTAENLDKALSIFGSLYDGGDFCKGYTYSLVATQTAMRFAEYFRLKAFYKSWSNPPEHNVEAFMKPGRRTLIITHRGNDLGPENSMKALAGTVDTELEGIEADVSSRFKRII